MEAQPIVHLTQELSIEEVAYGNPIFDFEPNDLKVLDFDPDDPNSSQTEKNLDLRSIHKFEKLEPYQKLELLEPDAFKKMRKRMKALRPDGMIMKQIDKVGFGEIPNYDSDDRYVIQYHYAAYTESNDMPFDIVAPEIARKPATVAIGAESIIPGLEQALKSMRQGEKASFLVHPYLAYRDGQPPRIPKQATILFVINVLNINICNEMENEYKPPSFNEIMKKVDEICQSASTFKHNGNNQRAIQKYRKAETVLNNANYANKEEEQLGCQKLMTIYSNLAICHLHSNDWKRVCCAFNNAKYCNPRLAYKNIKLLYNSSKALRMLHDYQEAKKRLQIALRIDPKNKDLLQEKKILEESANNARRKEMALYKDMLGLKEEMTDRDEQEIIDFVEGDNEGFVEAMRDYLKKFKENPEEYKELDVSEFTSIELDCLRMECWRQKIRIQRKDTKIIFHVIGF